MYYYISIVGHGSLESKQNLIFTYMAVSMVELEEIRLDKTEQKALANALTDINDEVYVFGSRLRHDGKGGDIDLIVFSKEESLSLSRKIAQRFFKECEEKIDVLVMDKDNLTEEQEAFVSTLEMKRIK